MAFSSFTMLGLGLTVRYSAVGVGVKSASLSSHLDWRDISLIILKISVRGFFRAVLPPPNSFEVAFSTEA